MRMTLPQTFVIDKKFGQLMKIGIGVFVAFALLGIALPFLPNESANGCSQPISPERTYILSIVCTLFSGALAWYSARIVKALPLQSITVDGDGFWLAHLAKEAALVQWTDIAAIRERPILQRLDLLDNEGNTLLKLEYQLVQFAELRSLVMEKTSGQLAAPPLPFSSAKPTIYHLFYAGGIVGFGLLGWFVGQKSPWLGYAGMTGLVAVIAYEYLTTVSLVTVDRDYLLIAYPTVRRTYSWSDIESIQLGDFVDQNGAMHPQLTVIAKGCKKPFRLRSLGKNTIALHRALMAARKAWQHDPQPSVPGHAPTSGAPLN
jgi:hypothetical protein